MRDHVASSDEAESNARWRDWQSHGDDAERRRLRMLRAVGLMIAVALTVWALVQLA